MQTRLADLVREVEAIAALEDSVKDSLLDYADEFVDDVSGREHSTGNTVLISIQTSKH